MVQNLNQILKAYSIATVLRKKNTILKKPTTEGYFPLQLLIITIGLQSGITNENCKPVRTIIIIHSSTK